MNNIRLAIVRQKYRYDGGAERFVSRALDALKNTPLDLNIITRNWQDTLNPNCTLHLCDPVIWGRVSRERDFARAARACWEREHFDIVQSHDRIAGCDIFRAGDGVHRVWLEQRARITTALQRFTTKINPYNRYVLRAEEEMFRSATLKKIICNSEMVKRDIIRYFQVPEEKFAVIYNAIDSQLFQPSNAKTRYAARQSLHIPEKACALIFVGSGFERKGLAAAIKAIAHSDRYLIVVGLDKQLHRYQQLANQLHCLNRIRFVGKQHNVITFYHAADALILPTLYDPFPNVILEAMACGLPVITSYNCGGAEFIIDGQEGFVCDALDINTLQHAVNAIQARTVDTTMSEAARTRIVPYTSQRLATALNMLYQQLLKQHH